MVSDWHSTPCFILLTGYTGYEVGKESINCSHHPELGNPDRRRINLPSRLTRNDEKSMRIKEQRIQQREKKGGFAEGGKDFKKKASRRNLKQNLCILDPGPSLGWSEPLCWPPNTRFYPSPVCMPGPLAQSGANALYAALGGWHQLLKAYLELHSKYFSYPTFCYWF